MSSSEKWVMAFVLILSGFFIFNHHTNHMRAKGAGQFTVCHYNLKNMGEALEKYADDYKGEYPPSLSYLVPHYLKSIPTCPAAGKDTYSEMYETSPDRKAYTVYCKGRNHRIIGVEGDNYPRFDSIDGLTARP